MVILAALNDEGCRAILRATDGEALSANDISTALDMPLSTVYRKIDRLSDAGLVDSRIHVSTDGKHYEEYVRGIGDVVVSLEPDDGVAVAVSTLSASEQSATPGADSE